MAEVMFCLGSKINFSKDPTLWQLISLKIGFLLSLVPTYEINLFLHIFL